MSIALRVFLAVSLWLILAAVGTSQETTTDAETPPPAADSEQEASSDESGSLSDEPADDSDEATNHDADDQSAQDKQSKGEPAEGETEPPPATPAADPDAGRAEVAEFQKLFAEWKGIIAETRELALKYKAARAADRPPIRKKYDELIARGDAISGALKSSAEVAYAATSGTNKEVSNFLAELAKYDIEHDLYEDALRRAELLVTHGYANARAYGLAGQAAFSLHEFEKAAEYLEKAQAARALTPEGAKQVEFARSYEELWAKEQEIRAAESKADDLPRVKLETSKGDIVIELFENEAPNTVANFISLVEAGTYDNTVFHRVLPGFMAQGGDPKGDGSGGPGYHIPCECYAKNARMHFSGSLRMAHAGRNTGGSQFFLTFNPTGHLNGAHTVFGRTIEGMDILAKIQRRDPEKPPMPEPDRIIKATVLRKRDHEYVPKKVGED